MLFDKLIGGMEIEAGLKQELIWENIILLLGLGVLMRDRVSLGPLFYKTRFYEEGLMTYEEFVERLSLELWLAEGRAKRGKKENAGNKLPKMAKHQRIINRKT